MMIAVAGPYSAATAEERGRNLNALNEAALAVYRLGHCPVVGVNAALPVVGGLSDDERYDAIMTISLALVGACDAIMMIGRSPGADREMDLLRSQGRPVYFGIDEIPPP